MIVWSLYIWLGTGWVDYGSFKGKAECEADYAVIDANVKGYSGPGGGASIGPHVCKQHKLPEPK